MNPRPLLVFDGDCGFCLKSLAWLRRRVGFWPEAVAWQEADLVELGLGESACRSAIQWVDEHDRAHPGALAFAELFKHQGRRPLRLAGAVLGLVPFRWIAQGGYSVVARNRHRLPGASAACSIADRAVVFQPERSRTSTPRRSP